MSVGQRLKRARDLKGLTQKELANKIGVHFTMISKWEKGTAIPEARLPELAEALEVPVKELREGKANDGERLAAWRDQVAEAELEEGVRFLLLCLPVFADEETRVVAITKEDFAKRLHLDVERVDRDWPKMLESGFVERLGSPGVSDQVLKLKN